MKMNIDLNKKNYSKMFPKDFCLEDYFGDTREQMEPIDE